MAITAPTPIAALPAAPDPNDRATFNARAYPWAAAQAVMVAQTNAVATNVFNNATEAQAQAGTATTQAGIATTQAGIATTQAINSQNSADASAASALSAVNAPGTNATSTTSLTIGTGSKSLTIQTGKSIVVGMSVAISYTTAPANRMVGVVTGYNSGTGALDVSVTLPEGSGAYTAWTVSMTAAVDLASFLRIPQNSQSAAYTLVLGDAGKHILHPSADTTARIFTIPANASVAYPIGTAITFVNQVSAGTLTIAITSDVMRMAGPGTTGSRSLLANGVATAIKIAATEWIISGVNLS